MDKLCGVCNKPFSTQFSRTMFCSDRCRNIWEREKERERRKRNKIKAEAVRINERNQTLNDKVAAAHSLNVSYGTIAALEQAKTVKITRKPLKRA